MHLISVTEAARRLDCSTGHVYNLAAAGKFQLVNIGLNGRSKSRLYVDELEAYVAKNTRRAS